MANISIPKSDKATRIALQKLSSRLSWSSIPTFANVRLTDLTANSLVYPDSTGLLNSLGAATNGQIPIGSTGATPVLAGLTGTANQITVTPGAGSITLSTPQDIAQSSSPTFAGLTITNCAVLGSNSAVFQPNADSTTFFQVLDADGGTPVFNVDSTNEYVGIGTNAPVRMLHISGNAPYIAFEETDASNKKYYFGGNAGDLKIFEDTGASTQRFCIEAGGYVSIGTINPSQLLHLYENVDAMSRLQIQNPNTGTAAQVGFELDNDAGQVLCTFYGSNYTDATLQNALYYKNAVGDVLFVANTGSEIGFGIGTAAANADDLVIDSLGVININKIAETGIRESCLKIKVSDAGNDVVGIANATSSNARLAGSFYGYCTAYASAPLYFNSYIAASEDTGTAPLMQFLARRTDSATDPANGNFSAIATRPLFSWRNDTTTYMLMDKSGNLGLNEIAPETTIEVTTTNPYITLHNSTHEDSDGGRESLIQFFGEQSGGEETTLAKILVQHDGAADDQKGELLIYTNDGNDGDTPTAHIKLDAAGITYIGDAGTTNYTKIEADGTLEFNGTATVWDDIRIIPGSFDRPGTSDPAYVAYDINGSGTNTYLTEWAVDDIASFTVQLPHSYHQGEDISVHLHWTPGPNGAGENGNYVGWKVIYSWANIDGTFGNPTTADLSDICDGTDHKHQMTPAVTITGSGKTISSMLICNITRTDTGADDTWAGTGAGNLPLLLEVDFHFPINTVGSRTATAK